jgi:integral membrane protein
MTVTRFRLVAVAEAVTWLVMIGAVVAKRIVGVDGATAVIGPVHGLVFLAYLASVGFLREELGWSGRRTLAAIGAAVVPLGTYLLVERRYLAVPSPAAVAPAPAPVPARRAGVDPTAD